MPRPASSRAIAAAAILFWFASAPAAAQSQVPASPAGQDLTVVRCDPRTNACAEEEEGQTFTMPVLGPAGRATVLSPNLRSTELSLDQTDYRFLIPGCAPTATGVFACDSSHQYQHCRTLMYSSMVYSCRAPNPLDAGFAEAREAAPGEYEIELESNARVKVAQGQRGFGQARGSAEIVLAFTTPNTIAGGSCLQQDRFLFYPTGPDGGASRIDETASCSASLSFEFEPHADDIVRAYDICESFSAWGGELKDQIEIVAAGLFHIRSADPAAGAGPESRIAIIAPWVSVRAPLAIDCAD